MAFPPTLHPHPAATVYLDGLIFLVHDGQKRLCQAAIHTRAAHHALRVRVTRTNDGKVLFPPEGGQGFDGSHRNVKSVAPLQLFVDCGGGPNPEESSAGLYAPDDKSDERAFVKVLDFEGELYERQLKFHPEMFAVLEIAQGEFYSAEVEDFALKSFPQGRRDEVKLEGNIRSCSLVGADIEGGAGCHLVLRQSNPEREVFRIELKDGEHYAVEILNVPMPGMGDMEGMDIAEHFLRFYDLFDLDPGERVFFVEPPDGKIVIETVDSPPCNTSGGSKTGGFTQP